MIFLEKYILIYFLVLLANCHSGYSLTYDESDDDPRKQAPWVASIFKQNEKGMWKFHCGATLINSHIVITATSCVLADYRCWIPLHLKYSDFRVVVGLSTSDYYENRDEHTQEAEVSFISEHKPSRQPGSACSSSLQKRANLAGVFLKNEFNLTQFAKPAEIVPAKISKSVSETKFLEGGKSVVIAGFNKNRLEDKGTSQLEIFELQIQPNDQCYNAYKKYSLSTIDINVFCGHPNGTFPCFLEGSGAVSPLSVDFDKDGIVHSPLMGVYTSNTVTATSSFLNGYYFWPTLDKDTKCSQNETAFFTKHGEYTGWATSLTSCGPTKLKCQKDGCFDPDELCDGIPQCKDKTDESVQACMNQKNCTEGQFRCKYGACIDEHKMCDGNQDCADNSDESDDEKCREVDKMRNITCPPIPPKSGVMAKCYSQGSDRGDKCNTNSVPVRTTVSLYCEDYYRGTSQEIECQRNGNWSVSVNEFLTCVPDCGISGSKVPHIVGGSTAGTIEEWPWHAAIYKKNKTTTKWDYFCGGSLISTRVVLTAAHCITEKNSKQLLDEQQLSIVFGKFFSAYDKIEKSAQEKKIFKLVRHESYDPGPLAYDIGLISLKTPVKITSSVRPVCFSNNRKLNQMQFKDASFENGTQFGTVVGFGKDESNENSDELKVLKMPYIPLGVCEPQFKKKRKIVLQELFCGGYTNGSAVCQGDSGGGFVFPLNGSYPGSKFNQRYYVQGVMSHGDAPNNKDKDKDPCNKNTYKYFMNVVYFADWIQRNLNQTGFNNDSEENLAWTGEDFSSVTGYSGVDVSGVGSAIKNEATFSTLISAMFLLIKINLI